MPFTITDPGTTPIFSDDFSSDTRADYTYLVGASGNLSVGSGVLSSAGTSQTLFAPTALTARKSYIVKVKITIPGTGTHYPGLMLKGIDASNHVYTTFDTDTGEIKFWRVVGGSATTDDSMSVSGGVRTTLWQLGGCFGDAFFCNVYTSDPEAGAATPVASVSSNVTDAALRGNVAGKPGLESFNTASHTFDDFKVWSAGAHAFNL